MKRHLLFSLTKKDFTISTFCTGGPGGQHQNSNQNGVRITHNDSGATGEGREFRSQVQNKKAAFERLVQSKKFQAWHKLEVAKRLGRIKEVENAVEEAMDEKNIKIEYF